MYSQAIEILENGSKQYQNLMDEEELIVIDEAVGELRNPCLNKNDLRKMANKAQKIIYNYSNDKNDLDELVGY